MSSYKSDPQLIACDIATVYSKLSDPSSFKKTIDANVDSLADDARENLKKVTFDADAITIESPMGPVKLVVAQKVEPTMITYAAAQAPVNFSLVINLEPVDDNTTRSQAELQLEARSSSAAPSSLAKCSPSCPTKTCSLARAAHT